MSKTVVILAVILAVPFSALVYAAVNGTPQEIGGALILFSLFAIMIYLGFRDQKGGGE